MTFHEFFFWLIALVTCGCAIAVAVTQNIVRAAVYLLFTFAGIAGLFFLLGADFVGALQLLIYVGGILVLLVFGVMLTAGGPLARFKAGAGDWAMSIIVGLLLFGLLGGTIALARWEFEETQPDEPHTSRSGNDLGGALLGMDDYTAREKLPVQPKARPAHETIMRKRISYLFPFEIVSVHLLVVLLAAAYLARAKRRRGASSS